MLGIKRGEGAQVNPGDILVRQRGTRWYPGPGVTTGKDHTLHATTNGRVVFRYDLHRQKKIVCVEDESGYQAPLVGFGSRKETKEKLANAVDAETYLKLDGLGRYQYVLELAKKLVKEEEQKKLAELEQRLVQPRRGKFGLVDLTLV
jgi:large subunit ribosomal protein L27